ncbi:hypothetical protein AAC387_Pa01g3844 [Persea americana]
MAVSATEALLGDSVYGAVDYKGNPVTRSTTGGWRAASFIIGVEMAERFAYYGVSSNLMSYLTGPLHQSTSVAAENVNAWLGAVSMLPLLGAFVADSYLGRYRTILFSSIIYVLGLGLLTLSAALHSLQPAACEIENLSTSSCPSRTRFQVVFFFFSLYVVALAEGGHKPCVQAFGADQFDPHNPEESKSKSSFFNWWYFGVCSVFLLGTKTYRYYVKEKKDPFMSILVVFVAATHKRQGPSSSTDTKSLLPIDYEARKAPLHSSSTQFNCFLDQDAAAKENSDSLKECWSVCSMSQLEDANLVLRLFPVWATCLIYGVVVAQSYTFFTKQGSTMERGIVSGFQMPPATFQTFICLSVVTLIPVYDRAFVPVTRAITGLPSGITLLQRIGIGMFLSVVSMVVAALVEAQRLAVARDAGLIDNPTTTVPMSVWWLLPQYVLFGVVEVFALIGLQEFFYDQVPDGMRSMGLSLYLSIFGLGSFISGFLISVIEKVTTTDNGDSWFSNNLNRAHVDYFYWLLAGLNAIGLGIYLYFANSYTYKNKRRNAPSI